MKNDSYAARLERGFTAITPLAAEREAAVAAWRAPNHSGSGNDWAYRDADDRFENISGEPCGEPLYTGPCAKLLPLTEVVIKRLMEDNNLHFGKYAVKLIRVVEAAHGIKEQP